MPEHEPFEIVLAHLDGYVRVKLRGDLDFQTASEHAEALQAVTDLRERVVVDLAELQFIDSAGLRFLVVLASMHDGPMRLENAPPAIARVVEMTGLAGMFAFDSD
jgi:anti-sigma B factor antagonist